MLSVVDTALTLFFLSLFIYFKDFFKKQISFFVFLFMVNVVLSEFIFGKEFASRSIIGSFSMTEVKNLVVCFSIPVLLIGGKSKLCEPELRYSYQFGPVMFLMLPLFLFFIYYIFTRGYRLTGGEFLEFTGQRSIIVDYVYIIFAGLFILFRKNKLVLFIGFLLFLGHFLAGERMRAYVYLITLFLVNFNLMEKRNFSSLLLIIGFFGATVIGFLRAGFDNLFVYDGDYNITHFGSVTVSSLYILDYYSVQSFGTKVGYLFGIFLGNLVPSAVIPESLDIRESIFNNANIPGGGWLPVFLNPFASTSFSIFLGMFFGLFYSSLLALSNRIKFSKYSLVIYAFIIVFIATLPRWFMYSPFQVIRFPLYTALVVLFFIQIYYKNNDKTS